MRDRIVVVHFLDKRRPVEGYVRVGEAATSIQPLGMEPLDEPAGVLTADISHIRIRTESPEAYGEKRGAAYGVLPALVVMGAGAVAAVNDTPCTAAWGPGDCASTRLAWGATLGALAVTVGYLRGGGANEFEKTLMVYEAPITRYPDAALALLTAEPLAEPNPTATSAPEAAAPER
ncbi:hypothetical protein [Rubricoccus marinus]|nr:hypothetical protein [Rubricoccus marinus]